MRKLTRKKAVLLTIICSWVFAPPTRSNLNEDGGWGLQGFEPDVHCPACPRTSPKAVSFTLQAGFKFREQKPDTLPTRHDRSRAVRREGAASAYKNNAPIRKNLAYPESTGDLSRQLRLYIQLVQTEEKRKNYKQALHYMKRYAAVSDSICKHRTNNNGYNRTATDTIRELERKIRSAEALNVLLPIIKTERSVLFAVTNMALLVILLMHKKQVRSSIFIKQITESHEMLSTLNQTKDHLFAIIGHDLRSAISNIKISILRIETELVAGNIAEALLVNNHAVRICNSTYALLNNLLYWSLSQTGQLSFWPERIKLKAIIDQVCYDFIPMATFKKIALNNAVTPDLFFTGDINSVKLIFRNLIDNALKYTQESGDVTIDGTAAGNQCIVTVRDSGSGIQATVVESLGDKFNRRIEKDNQGKRSTGLGLWLSKTMAERNGGNLRILTDRPIGTEVVVSLPLNAQL